ncbi:MAG: trypsin-like peptidase domain-containing protein [Bacillota bacterium]|nr:trypsin-like peptidase domain-containing protein [Bacillota bacterium]
MKRAKRYLVGMVALLAIIMVLTGCGTSPPSVDQDTKTTEFTKPAVVRVISFNTATYVLDPALIRYLGTNETEVEYYDGGMGSGAIISENGYVVTNAHVVEATKLSDDEATKRLNEMFLQDVKKRLIAKGDQYIVSDMEYVQKTTIRKNFKKYALVITPGGERFTFDIKSYGAPIGQGKDVAVIKIDAKNLPVILVDDTDEIQTSEKVSIAGYPAKADLNGLADDNAILVSTYTSGTVAARKSTDKGPVLQLSANVNPGNSGGPVMSKDGKIIGIATATSNDGIGWAIPSSTIMEFARQAGAPINQPGSVTQRWQEGLTLYWQNYYTKAIPKFEEIQRLYPKYLGVSDYISKSQKAINEGKDRKDLKDYWPILTGGTIVVILIIVVVIVLVRNKHKKALVSPNPQPEPQDNPLPPTLSDPNLRGPEDSSH